VIKHMRMKGGVSFGSGTSNAGCGHPAAQQTAGDGRAGRNLTRQPSASSRNRLLNAGSYFCFGGLALSVATLLPSKAYALELYDSGNGVEISLNTTVSFSSFYRVNAPSKIEEQDPNSDDGDFNFQHGFVGNVFEILPVLDIKDGTFGAHFSGEYFVNTAYLQSNQNDSPATVNPYNVNSDGFARETVTSNGHNGKLLDAFVYDSAHFDGQTLTLKAGQQTLFWGQSLFYGTNGIAGGQAPIDVVSAQDLVNPQSQQIFLPVGQIVATYQPDDTYTLQAYYQYQWEPYSFQGVGSYFSTTDVVGPGNQRIVAIKGTTSSNGYYFYNTRALTPPSQNGQFGASVQAQYGNYDVGLFALRYDSKTPSVYETVGPYNIGDPNGPSIGPFRLVYPRDIQLYGASISTTIGATNVAGELSGRRNMNLVGGAAPITAGPGANYGNASSDPLYPVGNTLTGLASFIYGSPALRLVPGGVTLLGEVEYVKVLGVTANQAALAPGRTSSASAFDVEVTPAYFNVVPNLELQFPVSLSYNYAGNSQMDTTMNHGTGTVSAGITATYRQVWIASLNYVDYFGKPASASLEPNASFFSDRGYVTFNIQCSF
jgi:hypothetical protein